MRDQYFEALMDLFCRMDNPEERKIVAEAMIAVNKWVQTATDAAYQRGFELISQFGRILDEDEGEFQELDLT